MAKKTRSIDDIFASINKSIENLIEEFNSKDKNDENSKEFNTRWQSIIFEELKCDPIKLKSKLCSDLKTKAEQFANSIEYISEFNKFDLQSYHIELESKTKALLKLGTIPENWRIFNLEPDNEINCIKITFGNSAINNGRDLVGFIYLSNKGVVKHCFTQLNSQ